MTVMLKVAVSAMMVDSEMELQYHMRRPPLATSRLAGYMYSFSLSWPWRSLNFGTLSNAILNQCGLMND
jgi:hypothetical protein